MAKIKNPERDKPRLSVVGKVTERPLSILLVDTDETSFMKARHVLKDLPIASLKVATKAETSDSRSADP